MMQSTLRLLLVLSASLLLSACSKDMSDLDDYIAEVKARKSGEIPPIPETRPYETFLYTAHALRDPFSSGDLDDGDQFAGPVGNTGGPQPDRTRRKEALESFPLDALEMVGTMEYAPDTWALVADSDGIIHRVKVGNYMGKNHGRIVSISEDRIDLVELVPDGLGGWMERQSSLALDE